MSEIPVSEILGRYPADRISSLAVLGDIQAEYKYLPREALEETAKWLHVQLSEIYQIATFFKAFSLTPKGDHIIKVCLGTACYVGGGSRILAAMEKALGIKAGSTTADYKFSLEAIRCMGACALGPVVAVDDHVHGQMSDTKAANLISSLRQEEVPTEPKEA